MSNEIHIHIHIHTDAPLTANNELERVIADAIKQALEAQKPQPVESPATPIIPYVSSLPYLQPPYTITSGSTSTSSAISDKDKHYFVWYATPCGG